jgi:hypothetical protein
MTRTFWRFLSYAIGVPFGVTLYACDFCVSRDNISIQTGTYTIGNEELLDATVLVQAGDVTIEYTTVDGIRWRIHYDVVGWQDDLGREVTYTD